MAKRYDFISFCVFYSLNAVLNADDSDTKTDGDVDENGDHEDGNNVDGRRL